MSGIRTMTFPNCFYETKQYQFVLQNTAIPTGLLKNPLDLVNSPRPWVMVNQSLSVKEPQKKTLIFADHFFQSRSQEQQHLIISHLFAARREGFHILIQLPDGELKEWSSRNDISPDYTLDLQTYVKEAINNLAYTQHKLGVAHIFVLDYFGINALLGEDENLIDRHFFHKQPDAFFSLISTSNKSTFQLDISSATDLS
ncbi:MAG: hypothetical protein ACHQIM_21780, partial [Sphingobacteriales bacterium]